MNKAGEIVANAKTYVVKRGSAELASIFDATGKSIANPLTSGADGYFKFGAADGEYDIQFEVNGEKGVKYAITFIDSSKLKTDLEGISTSVDSVKSDVTVLKTDVSSTKTDVTNLGKKVTANETAISGFDSRITDVEDVAGSAKTAADKASSDVATVKTTVDKNTTDIASVKTTADTAKTASDKATSDVAAVKTTADAAKSASDKNTTDIASVKTTADKAATDISTMKTAVDQNTADISTATSTANGAKTAADKATSDVAAVKTTADKAASDAAAVKSTADTAAADASTAKTDATNALASSDNLSSRVNGLANFAALRSRTPAYEGERVYIRCHTSSALSVFMPEGAGWFIGRLTKQADDGGYVASAGGNWHWQRDKDIADLYIGDFGGVADATTDAKPALQLYMDFIHGSYARQRTGGTVSGSTVNGGTSPYLGIKFGAGTYYVTPGEYNKYGATAWSAEQIALNPSGYQAHSGISIQGELTSFGRLIATKIISDKTDKPVFLINHRRFNVKNITWDGRQTTPRNVWSTSAPNGTNLVQGATTVDDQVNFVSNKQPFLKNECPSGCYMKLTNLQINNIGGPAFAVLDTLDSIIEEVYSSNTAAPVFQGGWSDPTNAYTGAWDHATSLEVRNCNFSVCMGPVIWAPRCAQSLMRNVWFEHGTVPFDINNGQWDIDMLCIEDCKFNPTAWNCKLSIRTLSVPTGNNVDTDSPTSGRWNSFTKNPDGSDITAWSEAYGQGDYLLMNYGAYFNCPMQVREHHGVLRGTNNTDNVLWVNVGTFSNAPSIGSWRVRVIGGSFYNTGTVQAMLSDRTLGEATINIGRGQGATPKATFYVEGNGPLGAEPQYQSQQYNAEIPALWVPIRARVGEYTIFVEATGNTRRDAGTPSKYTPNGATQTTNPNLNKIQGRFSFHTLKAGFGAADDVVEIVSRKATVAATPVNTAAPKMFIRINTNGQEMAWPIYAFIPQFTTNIPTTQTVVAGGTLTLTVVVTDAVQYQWQKSVDSGTTWTNISGATSLTYTKANVTADDAGQYRLSVRENDGNGGNAGSNYYSNVCTVTIS